MEKCRDKFYLNFDKQYVEKQINRKLFRNKNIYPQLFIKIFIKYNKTN